MVEPVLSVVEPVLSVVEPVETKLLRLRTAPARRIYGYEQRAPSARPVRDGCTSRSRRTGQACARRARGPLVGTLEDRRDLHVRPHQDPGADLLDRHSPADRLRVAARRPRLLLHPHRPRRAVPADARQGGLLPHRVGRQRAADRATGAELLRRPLRPRAALRPRLHAPGEAGPQAAGPDQPAQLRRAVRGARPGGREGLRVAVAHPRPVGGLVAAVHHHRQALAGRVAARVPAQLRPRRGLPAGVADPLGRHVPDRGGAGRARGAGVRRRLPPGRVPQARRRAGLHRDHASRADPGGRRARRAPGRRALPAPVRVHRHLPRLRRGDPGAAARRRRDGQGRRHRDVLHVRRPGRRDVVARAAAAGAHGRRPRRPPAPRDARVAVIRAGRGGVRRPRREDHVQRPRGDGGEAARVRRPRRRAEAHAAHDELLRARRQAAGDRLDAAVVHPQRRPRPRAAQGAHRPRRRDRVAPRLHAAPLHQLGRGPQRRLADQPAAVLRHPVPGLVPARRRG